MSDYLEIEKQRLIKELVHLKRTTCSMSGLCGIRRVPETQVEQAMRYYQKQIQWIHNQQINEYNPNKH